MAQSRAIASGRLEVRRAALKDVDDFASYDLAMAVHVLYFWPDLLDEMNMIHDLLRPGGVAAIGYQLRHHMPAVAQRDFPATGHRLYDADVEVAELMTRAHLDCLRVRIMGEEGGPAGRLLLATRAN